MRHRPVLVALLFVVPLTGMVAAAGQDSLFGPFGIRMPIMTTEVRENVPAWMELPRQARIQAGDGLRFSPVRNSAVSSETLRIGVLVGALRNDGRCATALSARLQYVDEQWQPLGAAIPNEARVSEVSPGGLLPFRFRLRTIDESAAPPAAYVILVEEDGHALADPFSWDRWVAPEQATSVGGTPCPPPSTTIEATVTSRHTLRDGFVMGGTVTVAGGPAVPADGVVITAVLRDARQQVLDVLVGTPARRERTLTDGQLVPGVPVPYRLRTDMPVGSEVADIEVYVEVLPGSIVAPRPG